MTWTSAQLRRLSLWLMCAMLLAALAPTVSRARAWSQGSAVPWMEICTTTGTQRASIATPADGSAPQDTQPSMALMDHCVLCVLAADRMAPPTKPFEWKALPQAPPLLALLNPSAPQAVLHWTVRSRAPPAHA